MLKIENTEVIGWEHAIRGMRNPMNSWKKSDSLFCLNQDGCDNCPHYDCSDCPGILYSEGIRKVAGYVGDNDHDLMMRLANGGPVHAKYRRMITVYLDITAPLYWWKEFDTYKVGTVANSCSTMHKIHEKEFELSDFSVEHLMSFTSPGDERDIPRVDVSPLKDDTIVFSPSGVLEYVLIPSLNDCRERYLEYINRPTKNVDAHKKYAKELWWQMIQLLPSSYNQKRTVMLNYEVLRNIYISRKTHKLDEWREFCKWIESLPYSEIITGEKVEES